jgi:hypothetical protein
MEAFVRQRLEGKNPLMIPVVLDKLELPAIFRDLLYVDLRNGDVRDAARRIAVAAWRVSLEEVANDQARLFRCSFLSSDFEGVT